MRERASVSGDPDEKHCDDLIAAQSWNGHGRRWNYSKGDLELMNRSPTYHSDYDVRTSSATADGDEAKRN
jgi:hypothetical protein